ncbi:MAG: hypothetical protein NT133_15235 [Alphaproteobacteria bacterium]|nr:hypothetical protein [Alphaproteobacteria bacterium]
MARELIAAGTREHFDTARLRTWLTGADMPRNSVLPPYRMIESGMHRLEPLGASPLVLAPKLRVSLAELLAETGGPAEREYLRNLYSLAFVLGEPADLGRATAQAFRRGLPLPLAGDAELRQLLFNVTALNQENPDLSAVWLSLLGARGQKGGTGWWSGAGFTREDAWNGVRFMPKAIGPGIVAAPSIELIRRSLPLLARGIEAGIKDNCDRFSNLSENIDLLCDTWPGILPRRAVNQLWLFSDMPIWASGMLIIDATMNKSKLEDMAGPLHKFRAYVKTANFDSGIITGKENNNVPRDDKEIIPKYEIWMSDHYFGWRGTEPINMHDWPTQRAAAYLHLLNNAFDSTDGRIRFSDLTRILRQYRGAEQPRLRVRRPRTTY